MAVLRRQVLIGDLSRLRRVYRDPASFRQALAGVWFPDALAGIGTSAWRTAFGLDLASVDRFAAGGFHPSELVSVEGPIRPSAIDAALRSHGYRSSGAVLVRGPDGSIDTTTPEGRIALSSLDRVFVRPGWLLAASTSALAGQAVRGRTSLASDGQLGQLLRALGHTTAAVVVPAKVISPPEGVLVTPLARSSATMIAVAVDDAGPLARTLKIALLYETIGDARVSASAFNGRLAGLPVIGVTHSRPLGSLVSGFRVQIVGTRTVLITGRIRRGQNAGLWRTLFESGDLATLVRPL